MNNKGNYIVFTIGGKKDSNKDNGFWHTIKHKLTK